MTRKFNPHDLHWGESDRNVSERTGGRRNESAITSFLDELDVRSISFFVQTCGHSTGRATDSGWVSDVCPEGVTRQCRVPTTIFYPQTAPSDVEDEVQKLKDARIIANRLDVPLYVIRHHPFDYTFEHNVAVNRYVRGRRVQDQGHDWDDVVDALRSEQFRHEDDLRAREDAGARMMRRDHPHCNSRRVGWLPTPEGTPSRSVDLTLSMIIREIPGVRHIDIDAVVICDDCGQPYCLIEGTSDGLGAREGKRKASYMTESIASKFNADTMLIHHAIDDVDLESEVRAKTFSATSMEPIADDIGDWDVAFAQFEEIQDRHAARCRGPWKDRKNR